MIAASSPEVCVEGDPCVQLRACERLRRARCIVVIEQLLPLRTAREALEPRATQRPRHDLAAVNFQETLGEPIGLVCTGARALERVDQPSRTHIRVERVFLERRAVALRTPKPELRRGVGFEELGPDGLRRIAWRRLRACMRGDEKREPDDPSLPSRPGIPCRRPCHAIDLNRRGRWPMPADQRAAVCGILRP